MRSLSKKVMLSAAVGGALVLGAQAASARPDARSLREVDTIWVDSNVCTADIEDRLRDRGFFVTNSSRSADAHLVVDIYDRDSSRFDESARYSAKMRGDDNHVIFTASGTEYSPSSRLLCDDIGDSIADSIDEMA
jgi:hypothetical protein